MTIALWPEFVLQAAAIISGMFAVGVVVAYGLAVFIDWLKQRRGNRGQGFGV